MLDILNRFQNVNVQKIVNEIRKRNCWEYLKATYTLWRNLLVLFELKICRLSLADKNKNSLAHSGTISVVQFERRRHRLTLRTHTHTHITQTNTNPDTKKFILIFGLATYLCSRFDVLLGLLCFY